MERWRLNLFYWNAYKNFNVYWDQNSSSREVKDFSVSCLQNWIDINLCKRIVAFKFFLSERRASEWLNQCQSVSLRLREQRARVLVFVAFFSLYITKQFTKLQNYTFVLSKLCIMYA